MPLTPKTFLKYLWSLDSLEKNCNLSCRPKISYSYTFLLLKLTKWRQSDVNPGIFVYENLFTDSWVDVISVIFNSKKVYEDEIFGQQDTLQFFSRESKDYKCLRKIFGVRGTLKLRLHTTINRDDFASWWMRFNGSRTKVQRHLLTNAFCYLHTYITCTKMRNRPD